MLNFPSRVTLGMKCEELHLFSFPLKNAHSYLGSGHPKTCVCISSKKLGVCPRGRTWGVRRFCALLGLES